MDRSHVIALYDQDQRINIDYPDTRREITPDVVRLIDAWVYFPKHSQFASLWGGSTVSGFRRQGLYTALLAVRAQEASARGVRYLTVDASDMSRPILEKFGFEVIAHAYPCKWTAKDTELHEN